MIPIFIHFIKFPKLRDVGIYFETIVRFFVGGAKMRGGQYHDSVVRGKSVNLILTVGIWLEMEGLLQNLSVTIEVDFGSVQ